MSCSAKPAPLRLNSEEAWTKRRFGTPSSEPAISRRSRSCRRSSTHAVTPYEYFDKLEHYLTVGGKTQHESFAKRDQFAPELEYFSQCILDNREPEPNAEEAIDDLRVIEAILQSARTGKPVPLSPRQRTRRPNASQEAKKPAVGKEHPVHAPSPSLE